MVALALILCAAIAAMGVVMIFKPAIAHELTRLLADKTGMWVATAIRAVLGLGLLAAASDSKTPTLLKLAQPAHFDRRHRGANPRSGSTSANDRLVVGAETDDPNFLRSSGARFRDRFDLSHSLIRPTYA
jgi:hypothetical protein